MRQHLHDQVSFTAFTSLLEDFQQQSALLLATLPLHDLLEQQLELLGTNQQFQRLYYGQGYSLQPVTAENVQLTRSLLNLVQAQGKSIALPSLAIQHGADSVVEYIRRALIQRIVTEARTTATPQFTQDLARELMAIWSDTSRDASDKFESFLRRHYFALENHNSFYAGDLSEIVELNKTFKESDNPQELRPLHQQLLHLLQSVAGAYRPASGEIPLHLVRKWYEALGVGLTGYYFAQEVQGNSSTTLSPNLEPNQDPSGLMANHEAADELASVTSKPKRGRKPTKTSESASSEAQATSSSTTTKTTTRKGKKASNSTPSYQGVNFTNLNWEQLVAAPRAECNYLPREWRNLLTADAILSYIPADLPPLTHLVYRGMVSYYLRPQQRSELRTPQVPKVQPAAPVVTTPRRTRKEQPTTFQPRSTAQMREQQERQRHQGVDRAQLQRLSTQLNNLLRKS